MHDAVSLEEIKHMLHIENTDVIERVDQGISPCRAVPAELADGRMSQNGFRLDSDAETVSVFQETPDAEILQRLPQMDAVLIGCGLGQSEGTFAVVKAVLQNARCPVVVDADGINVLAGHKDILRGRAYPTILTPHDGEFCRFGGILEEDRIASAVRFARECNCILLLKGHRTCITDGETVYRNTTGNPGMAVGGSGDVLAGMIVSLLGQKLPGLEAAACAAWLHGAAGDLCAGELGQYAMLPSDMLNALPRLLK
jgi:NAD(P)H-hydrate epimerase